MAALFGRRKGSIQGDLNSYNKKVLICMDILEEMFLMSDSVCEFDGDQGIDRPLLEPEDGTGRVNTSFGEEPGLSGLDTTKE